MFSVFGLLLQSSAAFAPVQATGQTPALTTCTLYGYQDDSASDSQFFRMNLRTGTVTNIGAVATNEDLEAIDTQPATGAIFGFPDNGSDDSSAVLVTINRETGARTFVANVSSEYELPGASFNPITGELWAGADTNDNLYTINLSTGEPTLKLDVSKAGEPQALAWNNAGTLLFVAYDDKVYTTNGTAALELVADVAGEIEAMEFDELGNLLVGVHGDTNLYVLVGASLVDTGKNFGSDVETLTTACPVEPPTDSVKVDKKVDADGDGTFESNNTAANELGFRWGLDGATPNRLMGSSTDAAPGDHEVSENSVPGYHFVGWFTSGANGDDSDHDPDSDEDSARLVNDPPSTTDDDDDRDGGEHFSCQNPRGTTLPATFSIGTEGGDDDDPDNEEDSARLVNDTASTKEEGDGDDDDDGDDDHNGSVTVTLCNARNTGTLRVTKHVVGDAQASDWQLHVKRDGTDVSGSPQNGTESGTVYTLPTDSYLVSETGGPAGFTQTFSGDCTADGQVTVVTGQEKTCTLTNTENPPDQASLTVIKHVVGGSAEAADWTMHIKQGDADVFSFAGNEAPGTTKPLAPGSYRVTESGGPSGYALAYSGDCEASGDVPLSAGQHKTCTLTNTKNPEEPEVPQLTVIKHVVGSTKPASDFTMHVGGQSFPGSEQGTTRVLEPGTFTVTETGGQGFALSYSGDCNSLGQVTLANDEHKTCTLTNTFETGSLRVRKLVDDNGDGTFELGDEGANEIGFRWGLDDGTVSRLMGSTATDLPVGSHTVTENAVSGYARAGWYLGTDDRTCTNPRTTPLPATVAVQADSMTDVIFCNARLPEPVGAIAGLKYHDQNGNGSRDESEPGLSGVVIRLDTSTSTLTDSDGHYTFPNLSLGTYSVQEDVPQGWVATTPNPVTNVVVEADETTTVNFGNRQVLTNLTVTKTDGLASTLPGRELTYTIVVRNVGEHAAQTTTVTDTLPAQATHLRSTLDGADAPATVTPNAAGDQLAWSLGTLAPASERTLLVTVKLDDLFPAGTTALTNRVHVATVTPETSTQDNDATDDTLVPAAPTITITKTDAPDPVAAGANLTYTINWSVSGSAAASNVVVTDPLPLNTTFVSASQGGTLANGVVTWTLGTQFPGAAGTLTLVVKVANPIVNGTILTNTATMDSTENDPVSASATTPVQSGPVLSITKTENIAEFANPGQTVTYTITVTNATTATDTARAIVVTDTLPAGLVFEDGTAVKTFAAFDLPPGASQILTVNAIVLSTASAGTYQNTAKAKGSNTPEVSAVAEVAVRLPLIAAATAPELVITKTVNRDFVNPGQIVRYVVAVENVGETPALNVRVTDTLADHLTFVDGGGRSTTFSIGTLDPGQKYLLTYDVRVAKDAQRGEYKNLAVARADNAPSVTASTTIEVRKIQVLATTGAGWLDRLIAAVGISVLALGFILWRRRRQEPADLWT